MFGAFSQLARDIGTANAVFYSVSHVLRLASSGRVRLLKYYFTAQRVPDGDVTPPRRGQEIVVSEASPAEIHATLTSRPRSVIDSRLASGCRCLIARKDGELVGFQWLTMQDYPEDEVRCLFHFDPEDKCAWDFDIFVLPNSRLQPVFARLWDACNRILRDAGVRHSMSRINASNGASRRAHERIGARTVGWAMFLCIGSSQLAVFSSRPWFHASISKTSAPVLTVSRMARKLPES